MSTRWQIAAKLSDGKYGCIYVHCDGYPEYAMEVLKHYTNQEKIDRLISLGDCLCVLPEIEKCEPFAAKGEPWKDVCPSYGDSLEDAAEKHEYGNEQYKYFWDGKKWEMLTWQFN